MKKSLTLFLFSVCAWVASCSSGTNTAGTEIGNPETVSLSIVGINPTLAKLQTRLQSSGVSVTEARVVVDRIEFKAAEDCTQSSSESEIQYEGPYVANLLDNSSIPSLGDVTLPSGMYCKLKLRMAKLSKNDIPAGISDTDPIIDHAFYVTGTRGDGTPFIAKLEQNVDFELESSTPFSIGEDLSSALVLAFDLSTWMTGMDLDGADVTSGSILIDKDHNSELLDQFQSNIQESAKLFRDKNEDGGLDSSETSGDNLLAD